MIKTPKLFKGKERKFCGNSWDDLSKVLDSLCELEDSVLLTEKEDEAMHVAIQCVTEIMNRMKDGKKVLWDD